MKVRYLVIAALLAVAMASLALNYFFYKKAYIPLQQVRLDPAGLGFYPPALIEADQSRATSDNKPVLMFFGDSRSLSWPAPDVDGYTFINRGIGHQTSAQILARFDQHVVRDEPDVIVMQLCVNELKMIPLFPQAREEIVADCKRNISMLVTKASQIGAHVVLTTVFPLGDVPISRRILGISEPLIIPAIDEVNVNIKALTAEKVTVFDSYVLLLGDKRKINSDYSQDWLHLNEAGYRRLNKTLEKLLSQLPQDSSHN